MTPAAADPPTIGSSPAALAAASSAFSTAASSPAQKAILISVASAVARPLRPTTEAAGPTPRQLPPSSDRSSSARSATPSRITLDQDGHAQLARRGAGRSISAAAGANGEPAAAATTSCAAAASWHSQVTKAAAAGTDAAETPARRSARACRNCRRTACRGRSRPILDHLAARVRHRPVRQHDGDADAQCLAACRIAAAAGRLRPVASTRRQCPGRPRGRGRQVQGELLACPAEHPGQLVDPELRPAPARPGHRPHARGPGPAAACRPPGHSGAAGLPRPAGCRCRGQHGEASRPRRAITALASATLAGEAT